MTNILLHGYYYRYRSIRKNIIKPLVDAANYQEARNELDTAIAEHESKYPTEILQQKMDFNYGEKALMVHAMNHLVDAVINSNNPEYIDENGNTRNHSDIVKEELLAVPKPDYNILDPPVN